MAFHGHDIHGKSAISLGERVSALPCFAPQWNETNGKNRVTSVGTRPLLGSIHSQFINQLLIVNQFHN